MPNQVIPVTGLDTVGLIEDTPSVSLPPNAFTTVRNVRFRDGAARQFPAETPTPTSLTNIVYVAYWPAATEDYYVVIRDDGTDTIVSVFNTSWTSPTNSTAGSTLSGRTGGNWQHTLFNGGFQIILNDGTDTPISLTDGEIGTPELPGWDSYAAEEVLMEFEADGVNGQEIAVDVPLVEGSQIKITNIPRNTALPIVTETVTVDAGVNATTPGSTTPDGNLAGIGTIAAVLTTGFNFTPNDDSGGNTYRIAIVGELTANVTAGVVRAYGNLLVAGNLREDTGRVLTGTIRTSDVAGPGQIPTNWNPFQLGVNTADEFILASTGTIQDMVELQGVLYVYTDSSIHSIQQTGSPIIPFQISPVTDNYGADGVDSVIEVDGKHIVVGSDDVYIFAGHPGSISSIADGKVRDRFRVVNDWKIVRYNAFDELWFYRGQRDVLIWNYRNNTWTVRDNTTVPVSIASSRNDLLFATTGNIVGVNDTTSNLDNFLLQRDRLAITPEFDVETLASIALLATGNTTLDDEDEDNVIDVKVRGSNTPADERGVPDTLMDTKQFDFVTDDDYKTDIRVTGRFLNISIENTTEDEFTLSGIQLDIGKGGQR